MQKVKNIKFLIAILVLVFFAIFANSHTQNALKILFVKDSKKYVEMYAYAKTKPSNVGKYFVVQDNDAAISFFRGDVKPVNESDLSKVCSDSTKTLILYEKDSDIIKKFIMRAKGEVLTLNPGTDIQFFIGNIKGVQGVCHAGG